MSEKIAKSLKVELFLFQKVSWKKLCYASVD